jgi:hypothetical protein
MGAAPRIVVIAGDAVEAAVCELALGTGLAGAAITPSAARLPRGGRRRAGAARSGRAGAVVGRRSGDAVVAAPARKADEPPAGRW